VKRTLKAPLELKKNTQGRTGLERDPSSWLGFRPHWKGCGHTSWDGRKFVGYVGHSCPQLMDQQETTLWAQAS